jgi:hypothetical protein
MKPRMLWACHSVAPIISPRVAPLVRPKSKGPSEINCHGEGLAMAGGGARRCTPDAP